jgi:hypothetical protein
MAGESNFSLQIANLVGGATIDQEFCDDAAKDACKEIINQLPEKLKIKCSTRSTLNTSATTLDLDSKGDILHITRLSADSGGYELSCREIPAQYGDLTNDSTDLNYFATVTDPVYFITNNSSGNPTLFVRPNPTNAQPSYVHHITYPTVDVSADTIEIANFPDEATYLVVLFAATRQLLKFQTTMSASFNSDITETFTKANAELDETQLVCDAINTNTDSAVTALGNMATEVALANAEVDGVTTTLAQALALTDSGSTDIKTALTGMQTAVAKFRADAGDPALFGDESTYDTADSAMTNVKIHLDRAISYVNGDFPEADSDLVQYLKDINDQVTAEDTELAASFMSAAQITMNAMQADLQIAQTYITEWNTMVQTLVAEINAFASEAGSRFGWINAKAVAWQGKLSAAQGYMGTAGGYSTQANGFISAASSFAKEVQTKIAIANGYIAEASARLGADNAKYQWYGDQYAKLSAEYARGLAALKGGGE